MAAYVISEVEMRDETQGRRYRELAAGSIARHGGRYLVRGAAPVVAEGDWPANCQVAIVEFPTMERLRAWYASADYAEALAVRQTALDRRLLFVDGAHISPGLGWPASAEDLRRDHATEPPSSGTMTTSNHRASATTTM
jgi:uncharacterized protein (DUF1330 family)